MDNGACSYRRFLDGDEAAFDEIIKEYRLPLIFFINRYLNDADAAEDVAADVFVQLLVHPEKYSFKASFKTYLFMMGKSRAIDRLRREKRLFHTGENPPLQNTDSYYEELYGTVLTNEKKRRVNEALQTLSPDMQSAVHLVYFEELSYKQTAKILKKSTKQVDNLLYRAKNELRRLLEKEADWLL